MKVKVGNTAYEATKDQPVMVQLTQQDKHNIANMDPDATMYAVFHDDSPLSKEEKLVWMDFDATVNALPSPPVSSEPVATVNDLPGCNLISWEKGKVPPVGTKLYASPPVSSEPVAFIVHDDPELGDYLTKSRQAADATGKRVTPLYVMEQKHV